MSKIISAEFADTCAPYDYLRDETDAAGVQG